MKKAIVAASALALLGGCDTLTENRTPEATCVTGTWWVGGDTGHEEMHPGRDCVGCHRRNDGPPLALGGTVFPVEGQAENCYGAEGVTVEVTDANGVQHLLVTNAAGNFFLEGDESVIAKPYSVRLIAGLAPPGVAPTPGVPETPIPMGTKPMTGDCGFCHEQAIDIARNVGDPAMPVKSTLGARIDLRHTKEDYGVFDVAPVGGAGGI